MGGFGGKATRRETSAMAAGLENFAPQNEAEQGRSAMIL